MKAMSASVGRAIATQHGFAPGDYVRWLGKYEAPWRGGGKAAKVKELGRDLRGQVVVLVESNDIGPNVTDNTFPPRYKGRRVKVYF